MGENVNSWSKTASSNATADASINWAENQLPGTVNNSARSMMAAIAKFRDDNNGTLTSTGSANAYALSANTAYTALAQGLTICFRANFTNTGAATLTLTPNGGGAFAASAIRIAAVGGDVALAANQIPAGAHVVLQYDTAANSSAGAWMLLGASSDLIGTGSQTLIVAPTGNASISTASSLSVQGTTAKAAQREFLVNFGFTVNQGVSGTGGNQDKVALYAGIDTVAGNTSAGDIWAINTVTTLEAGTGTGYNAQGYELDFNNLQGHRGETDGGGGLAAPVAYGLNITGAGTFRSTAAILISGPGSAIWNRGIVIANSSVKQSSFQDIGASTISLDIRGSHSYGLDLGLGVFSTNPLRMPNGTGIAWLNAAGNANITPIAVNSSNEFLIGTGVFTNFGGTGHPLGTLDIQQGADHHLVIRTNVYLSSGMSLYSFNDAGDTIKGLELDGSPILCRIGPDVGLLMRGQQTLSDGVSLYSVNDANSLLKGLELAGTTIALTTATVRLPSLSLTTGAKSQARYFPMTIGSTVVNVLTD